jgi:UDP-N-acetylglucosamine--N-acetylmuramyl-(pentapeptide) pyrophosphoryl-undecaprenol N-acetylglucosamine transferase
MGLAHRIKSLAVLPGAVVEARGIIKRFRPDLVFGVGGYVTGPVLLAARLQGIPTCIHEQNAVPGLANRMIARFVDRIFVSIPGDYAFPAAKTIVAGNPVREEIIAAAREKKAATGDDTTLLVLGGSLGAHRINLLMLEAMVLLKEQGIRLNLIHQTGAADEERVRGGYAASGIKAEVAAFFSDMAGLYKRADLVVARAGATTLAELSVMGLPALLIPYPYAADDHQAKNASYYVDGGGARMIRESELDGKLLARMLKELLRNQEELHTLSANMKKLGRPEATREILESCLGLTSGDVD